MISDLRHAPPRHFGLRPWQAAATRNGPAGRHENPWPFLSSIPPSKSRTVLKSGNGDRWCAQGQDSSALGGRQAGQVKWQCVRGRAARRLRAPTAIFRLKGYKGRPQALHVLHVLHGQWRLPRTGGSPMSARRVCRHSYEYLPPSMLTSGGKHCKPCGKNTACPGEVKCVRCRGKAPAPERESAYMHGEKPLRQRPRPSCPSL